MGCCQRRLYAVVHIYRQRLVAIECSSRVLFQALQKDCDWYSIFIRKIIIIKAHTQQYNSYNVNKYPPTFQLFSLLVKIYKSLLVESTIPVLHSYIQANC